MISLKRRRIIILVFTGFLILLMVGGSISVLSKVRVAKEIVFTPTPMTTPGLLVFGYVVDKSEAGIEGVNIYRNYASYPGVVIATTDAEGYYQSDFYPIPGDEMVTIWAEGLGLRYEPEQYYWRHYYGYEGKECNFTAKDASENYLPIVSR
jgi:hypothetical protein